MPVLHRRVRRTFNLVEADQARVEAKSDRKADGRTCFHTKASDKNSLGYMLSIIRKPSTNILRVRCETTNARI